MKYSYEIKKESVQLYRDGKWPDTPEGPTKKTFMIQLEYGLG
ncbi:hypothetical protein [Peptoniphilus asaccharolyticus]|nr:hypothetical protein [Peptoniphilus asaccharolyticus]